MITFIFQYYKEGKLRQLYIEASSKETAVQLATDRARNNGGMMFNKKPVGSYVKKS